MDPTLCQPTTAAIQSFLPPSMQNIPTSNETLQLFSGFVCLHITALGNQCSSPLRRKWPDLKIH